MSEGEKPHKIRQRRRGKQRRQLANNDGSLHTESESATESVAGSETSAEGDWVKPKPTIQGPRVKPQGWKDWLKAENEYGRRNARVMMTRLRA